MIELSDIQKRFILHWGEMGTKWGINRTVAQVHALLFLSTRPLDAEEITDTLAVARSNVSGSLRELQSWGIVKMVHVMNDRRDHFESMKEPWEMFRVVSCGAGRTKATGDRSDAGDVEGGAGGNESEGRQGRAYRGAVRGVA
jgi:DNA-binding transcriptional regulator GbsR (MarR family)